MAVLGSPAVSKYIQNVTMEPCEQQSDGQFFSNWRPPLVSDGQNFLSMNQSALKYYQKMRAVCSYRSFQRNSNLDYPQVDDSVK